MRRKDREITDPKDIYTILEKCDTVRVSMQKDDTAYIVPLSFGCTVENGRTVIYFHCAKEGLKVYLLKKNPRVCVEGDVFLGIQTTDHGITTRCESIIGWGRCSFPEDEDTIIHGLRVLLQHYGFDHYDLSRCRGLSMLKVGRIELESMTGKRNLPVPET